MLASFPGSEDELPSAQSLVRGQTLSLRIPKRHTQRPLIPQRHTSLGAQTLHDSRITRAPYLPTPPATPPDSDAENNDDEDRRKRSSSQPPGPLVPGLLSPVSPIDPIDHSLQRVLSGQKRRASSPLQRTPTPIDGRGALEHTGLSGKQRYLDTQRRCISASSKLQRSLRTPDRFISCRQFNLERSQIFRTSKPPKALSQQEKLLRTSAVSEDPFERLMVVKKRRNPDKFFSDEIAKRRLQYGFRQVTGPSGLLDPFIDASPSSLREPSTGAVWNVGGSLKSLTARQGPPRGIPNGRGGRVVSGSNAPYFTATFIDENCMDQHDRETQSARLAAALDIDVAARVLKVPARSNPASGLYPTTTAYQSASSSVGSKTRWQDGQWIRSEDPNRMLPSFLCSCQICPYGASHIEQMFRTP